MDILVVQHLWIPLNANVSLNKCSQCHLSKSYFYDISACDCSKAGSNSMSCDQTTGKCLCKENVIGQKCDRCKPNHWNLAKENPLGCQPCDCSIDGSNSMSCDQTTGNCHCKANVTGQKCDKCKTNHWNLSEANPDGCEPCGCSEIGSKSMQCDSKNGNCICKPNVGGQKCDSCTPKHWNFTQEGCQSCDCSEYGSTSMDCDQETGHCDCKANVVGDKCDQCKGDAGKLNHDKDYDRCLKSSQAKAILQNTVIVSCCLLFAFFIIQV